MAHGNSGAVLDRKKQVIVEPLHPYDVNKQNISALEKATRKFSLDPNLSFEQLQVQLLIAQINCAIAKSFLATGFVQPKYEFPIDYSITGPDMVDSVIRKFMMADWSTSRRSDDQDVAIEAKLTIAP